MDIVDIIPIDLFWLNSGLIANIELEVVQLKSSSLAAYLAVVLPTVLAAVYLGKSRSYSSQTFNQIVPFLRSAFGIEGHRQRSR